MGDANVLRVGGWSAVIAGALAIAVNLLFPRDLDEPTSATAVTTANWELLQMGVIVAVLLSLIGLYAVAGSIRDAPARGWAALGLGAALMGATIGVALFAVQTTFARTAGLERDALVSADLVTGGLFFGWVIMFLGLAPGLYGLALIASTGHPTWLGSVAFVGGLLGLAAGVIAAFTSANEVTTFVLFPASSGLFTVVIIYLGVLLLREASA